MLTYTYVARDTKTGQKVKADIEADNEKLAARILTERGLAPLEINEKTQSFGLSSLRNHIPTKLRVIFARQLSTLINAGLPLVQSLNTVRGQTSNKALQDIIGKVITDVEAGSTLADALAKYPKVFDQVYISLVAAGEASGTLDVSLERLADQQEHDSEIVGKVRGAMIYPLMVLVVLFGVIIFMLTHVLPQVEQLYKGLPGTKLPIVTVILLKISGAVTHFWWIFLVGLIVAAVGFNRWSKTKEGREILDGLKLHAPLISPIFMKLYMARFARTSSTLVGSGVPMIKMLNTTSEAVNNTHISDSINKAIEQVKGGKSLSDSLKDDPNFLELVPNMIHIGEQSGALEDMLGKVAGYYEKEVDNQIKSISTIIEPALMVVVGVMALIIVAAVLLPIYSLAGKNLTTGL